eukprot:s818_g21.t2
MAIDLMTTMTQAPQEASLDQAKADPDQRHTSLRPPPVHPKSPTLLGIPDPILSQCVQPAAPSLGTNSQCITCDDSPLPSTWNSKISMPVFDYWCPGINQDGTPCGSLLGLGRCPLCDYHLRYIKQENNFYQNILPSSFEWTKVFQFDRCIHQLELPEEDAFAYYYRESSRQLPWIGNELDFKSFNFQDWPLYFILFYHIDPRIDEWLPVPHPVKTSFKLPNFDKDQIDFINSGYSINDRLLTDHLFICQWYADNIDKYTRYQHRHIMDIWNISFPDNPDIEPARTVNIPWDTLVASSALIALDSIDRSQIDYFPENFNDGFMDKILVTLYPNERNLYHMADKFAEFIQSSSIYVDIFLGLDPFTNNSLQLFKVKSHTGIPGNERADRNANLGLFSFSRVEYADDTVLIARMDASCLDSNFDFAPNSNVAFTCASVSLEGCKDVAISLNGSSCIDLNCTGNKVCQGLTVTNTSTDMCYYQGNLTFRPAGCLATPMPMCGNILRAPICCRGGGGCADCCPDPTSSTSSTSSMSSTSSAAGSSSTRSMSSTSSPAGSSSTRSMSSTSSPAGSSSTSSMSSTSSASGSDPSSTTASTRSIGSTTAGTATSSSSTTAATTTKRLYSQYDRHRRFRRFRRVRRRHG